MMEPRDFLFILFLVVVAAVPAIRWFVKRVAERSLDHQFDKRIEKFRAELADRDKALEGLRAMVVGGLAERRTEFERRRLDAIQGLWNEALTLQRLRFLGQMTMNLNMDAMLSLAAKSDSDGVKIRTWAGTLLDQAGVDGNGVVAGANAGAHRVFVSAKAWNLFEAYRTVHMAPIVQLVAVKAGAPDILQPVERMAAPIVAVLPELREYILRLGYAGITELAIGLEAQLLAELWSLSGDDDDDGRIAKAAALFQKAKDHLDPQASRALAEAPAGIVQKLKPDETSIKPSHPFAAAPGPTLGVR